MITLILIPEEMVSLNKESQLHGAKRQTSFFVHTLVSHAYIASNLNFVKVLYEYWYMTVTSTQNNFNDRLFTFK